MGQARQRKARFLAEHPWCCFCGGTAPSATIDHIPARSCFLGRAFPESFEFPACERCNAASRVDEIAFAFYVRMLDHTDMNFEGDDASRAITGMINNLPALLPKPPQSIRRRRDALKRMGIAQPTGSALDELPLLDIPDAAHEAIKRYARKLACAIRYRERKRPASREHAILVSWGQLVDRNFMEGAKGFLAMPNLHIGERRNVEFGNQFAYRHVGADDPDVFGMIAQFGTGMVICAMVVAPEVAKRMTVSGREMGLTIYEDWTLVRDNYV